MSLPAELAHLPAPQVVEELDVETLLQGRITTLNNRYAAAGLEYSASMLAYDPARIQLEVSAYTELLLRQRVNEAARAQMLPFATGGDLDILAAFYGVTRLANETDARLRQRVVLAIQGRSTGGTEPRYKFVAMSASTRVADAVIYTIGRNPTIHVAVFSADNNGAADSELLETVNAALQDPHVRMVNDVIVVEAAARQSVNVEADVWLLPQASLTVLDTAKASLQAAWNTDMVLGRDLNHAWLMAKLMVDGVQRVNITAPVSTVSMPFNEAAALGSVTLNYRGRDY